MDEIPLERRKVIAGLILAVVFAGVGSLWLPGETERIERTTLWAAKKARLMSTGNVSSSPRLVIELIFSGGESEHTATQQYFAGMNRLEELGILEKRKFSLADATAMGAAMSDLRSALPVTMLWDAQTASNTIIVRAKGSEMERIEAIIGATGSHIATSTMK